MPLDPTIVSSIDPIVSQRAVMTRDGRVSDQKLYGNLTGTVHRQTHSIGRSSKNLSIDQSTSKNIEHLT